MTNRQIVNRRPALDYRRCLTQEAQETERSPAAAAANIRIRRSADRRPSWTGYPGRTQIRG